MAALIVNIDLENLGSNAKSIETSIDPAKLDLAGEPFSIAGPVGFKGEIRKEGDRLVLSGTIDAQAVIECSRCLEPIEQELTVPFGAIYSFSAENSGGEVEVAGEQLDESAISGEDFSLADALREQILLAVPEQIFCTEDCRGLCVRCGGNLNLIDCNCTSEDIDPRWAALKNIKRP